MPSRIIFTLYPQCDQYIQLTGLYTLTPDTFGNLTVKTYSSSAVVTATLYDVNLAPVPGLINLSLPFIAGSQGIYRGVVAGSGFNPPLGAYTLIVTITIGGSQLVFTFVTNIVLLQGN